MNKLGKKLIIRISFAIILLFAFSTFVGSLILPKYYLYQVKENVAETAEQIQGMKKEQFLASVNQFNTERNMIVVYDSLDKGEDEINDGIQTELAKQKIKLNKFWITGDVLEKIKTGKRVGVLYSQEKMKSSFLANFIEKDGLIILVGMSISHLGDTLKIMNEFNIYMIVFMLVVIILLIWILTERMTKPLKELKDISSDIANLSFKTVSIQTNDEIEELADTINEMSRKLEEAHGKLIEKNENLKRFTSDITHELKTPLALIKAYSMGIKDGLDDGTYVDTIVKQTDHVSDLIEYLLHYLKMERDEIVLTKVNMVELFQDCLRQYDITFQQRNMTVRVEIVGEDWNSLADKEKMEIVFHNFITNSIKYTNDNSIRIAFVKEGDSIRFTIRNGVQSMEEGQLEKLWESFYVLEASRSKDMSGTGLGLAIVKTILERHHNEYGVYVEDGEICFWVTFPVANVME